MAGHSKWANIRFRKGKQDAVRGKEFTKLIRAIVVAVKSGGGDADCNPRLRDAIDKARRANMKRDTIDNAIKRGLGGDADTNLMELWYEGYGPGGVAILVQCLSDNKNRTVSEVRHAFSKCGGSLGAEGSVAYLFNRQGQIILAPKSDGDKAMEIAIEAGADDILLDEEDQRFEVVTGQDKFHAVKNSLEQAGFLIEEADIIMQAAVKVAVVDHDGAEKVLELADMLEDLDDVQNVYTNADIPAEVLQAIAAAS